MNSEELDFEIEDNIISKIIDMVERKERNHHHQVLLEQQSLQQQSSKQSKKIQQQQFDEDQGHSFRLKNSQIYHSLPEIYENHDQSSPSEDIYIDRQKQKTNDAIYVQYEMLKQFFKEFLTQGLEQLQKITNLKLASIVKRLSKLQKCIERTNSKMNGSRHSQNQLRQKGRFFNSYKVFDSGVKKRHKYIKAWKKLEYIRQIQKGQNNIRGIARQLKLKDSVIQTWINNKELLIQKSKFQNKHDPKQESQEHYEQQELE